MINVTVGYYRVADCSNGGDRLLVDMDEALLDMDKGFIYV